MKKKILIAIIILLILVLLVSILEKRLHDRTTKNITEAETNSETYQKYSKTVDNVTLEMNIANGWQFEEIFEDENDNTYKFALKLYKSEDEKNAILYFYNEPFGVCGTGRTTKEITLNNGYTATIGYYGSTEWSDISFSLLNPNIAFINNGLENDEAEEFLELVKTLNIIFI
jgi:hypothetical protein